MIITNVINLTFKNLNAQDKNILEKYYTKLYNVIASSFGMDIDKFNKKLSQNNYRDGMGLLYLLIPYVNDKMDKANIKSLNDIYTKKQDETNTDIKTTSPKYLYSNIQYNRCDAENLTELVFSEDHIKQNFYLLCETIRMVSSKLYVNWINVIPYLEQEINDKTIPFIRNTFSAFKTFDSSSEFILQDVETNNINKKFHRLQMDDIYDSITNDLYYAVKDVKWLLYEIKINNNFISCRDFIDMYFGKFDVVYDESNNNIFETKWNDLKTMISTGTSEQYNIESLNVFMKGLIVFFDKNTMITKDKSYKHFKQEIDLENINKEGMQEIDIKINIKQLFRSIESAKPLDIYNHIKYSLEKLNNTFYGKKYAKIFSQNNNISLKNIYNFAKSFSHVISEADNFVPLPRYWRSFTQKLKTIIYDRLNNDKDTKWFNIARYIKDILKQPDVQKYQDHIRNNIIKNIIQLVLYNMYYCGRLSKFVFNNALTNEKNIPNDSRKKVWPGKISTLQNPDYGESYYFVGKKYNESKINNMTYFKYNSIEGWYTPYAMDYLLQISFFHRYLNNRVIFVTGAPGVGKSTNFPQLLLYALTAIDYKLDGIIGCSQPRNDPTINNSEFISKNMGVPIVDQNKNELNNYIIQYRTGERGSHEKPMSHNILKEYTDGLLEKLLNNFLLKRIGKDNTNSDLEIYTSKNEYDIIIVDESHEHNVNMDNILTFMNTVLYYNNQIKLVIVSATMDNDEPIYRRFYRQINDNQMFPLNTFNNVNKLDRINVDRRLHISAPGQTSRYLIKDYYIDKIKQKTPEELILYLAQQDTSSDILVFQEGEKEIKELIEKLNSILPSNTIALPYYRMLDPTKLSLFSNMSATKKQLKFDRKEDFNYVQDITQGNNTYTKVVIVATNIAEASITIDTLKYVVDNGKQKTNFYNYKNRAEELKLKDISESSREQRRGRVGRVSPGFAYFLYPEGTMANNKILYGIAKQNISYEIYRAIKETNDILFDHTTDPNINKNINLYTRSDIKKIVHEQYYIMDDYYDYLPNSTSKQLIIKTTYKTGFSIDKILDFEGKHYVIHPEELDIIRNITGTITQVTGELVLKNNMITSDKMYSFLYDLVAQSLLTGQIINEQKIDIYKTLVGKKLANFYEILTDIEIKLPQIICYFYAKVFDCTEEIIRFIALSRVMAMGKGFMNSIVSFSANKDKVIPDVRMHNTNNKSDIIYILGLLKHIHQEFVTIKYTGDSDVDKEYVKSFYVNIKTNAKIKNACKKLYIKYETVMRYINEYLKLHYNFYLLENQGLPKQKYSFIDLVKNVKSLNLKKYSEVNDNVTQCLLLAHPYNVIYKTYTAQKNNYISIFNAKLGYNLDKTFVENTYLSGYLLYFKIDLEEEKVSMLHYIKPELLGILSNVYSMELINNIKIGTNKNIKIKQDLTTYYNPEIRYKLKKISQ